MGYCFEYRPDKKRSYCGESIIRTAVLTMVCALLFVFLVNTIWPTGSLLLEEFLFDEKTIATAAEMDMFATDLERGVAFWEAVKQFLIKLRENEIFWFI